MSSAKKPGALKKLFYTLTFRGSKAKKTRISVLRLSGVIGQVGAFKKGLTLEELESDINRAFKQKNIACVALQVNSPGGSPVQSELIFNHIRNQAAKHKVPVLAFAEDVAASGGYWLACAGDEIYASQSSIVGSIGVIAAGFGFTDLIKKHGIERRIFTQGENKSILDPFSPTKKEDVTILTTAQKDVHDAFIAHVKKHRGDKIDADNGAIFSGEFYSGKKAAQLGLVDGNGTMGTILQEKYGDDIEFIKISKPKGWFKGKLGMHAPEQLARSLANIVDEKLFLSRFGL